MIASACDRIIRVFLGVAMLALLVMVLAIVADVFMRYVFNSPITGTYDVVETALVVTVFYSLGSVISGFHEILIDLVDQLAPAPLVLVLKRAAAGLSAAVLVFLFVAMLEPAVQSWRYGEMRLELNMPVWIVWAIALVGLSGGILASLLRLFRGEERR